MSFQTIYDFYGSSCHIHGCNLSFFFPFKGPKGDDGLPVSWSLSFWNIFLWNICLVFVLAKKWKSQSYKLLSIIVSVIFYNKSQYTLKPEHLTTVSRTPTNTKKWSRLLQIWNCCTIVSCKWKPITHPQLPTLMPENNPHRHGNNSTLLPSTWNSLFSWGQLHFLLFCCTVIFHQDVNLTF